jgi:hypothetical protein
MPSEPERPIEKLLRASAKERRDHAGDLELHPANRRLLQQEVARKFGRKPHSARMGWLGWFGAQWWGKVATGLAMLAVLGMVVWLTLPVRTHKESETLLARNEMTSESRAKTKGEISSAPADKPAPIELQQSPDHAGGQIASAPQNTTALREELADNAFESAGGRCEISNGSAGAASRS